MNDDVQWLIDEVNELFDAGRVGLYEFVEILRQRYPDSTAAALRPTCCAALKELLRDPAVQLGWYVWASGLDPEPALVSEVRPTTFDVIGGRRYLGIERRGFENPLK